MDFPGIPSWAKCVKVYFNSLSTTGSSVVIVRLGTSTGAVTTGYVGSASYMLTTVGTTSFTTGFAVGNNYSAACARTGMMEINNFLGNTWTEVVSISSPMTLETGNGAGIVGLPGVLDRIQITTVNGSDTFDGGSVCISYEG
jgi:hypothetical protein